MIFCVKSGLQKVSKYIYWFSYVSIAVKRYHDLWLKNIERMLGRETEPIVIRQWLWQQKDKHGVGEGIENIYLFHNLKKKKNDFELYELWNHRVCPLWYTPPSSSQTV